MKHRKGTKSVGFFFLTRQGRRMENNERLNVCDVLHILTQSVQVFWGFCEVFFTSSDYLKAIYY